MAGTPAAPPSLFDRIGGQETVAAAVDWFYLKVQRDPELERFFEATDMDVQKRKQRAFLTMAFGGPANYTGRHLRSAHDFLVTEGLEDSHFDAVAGHLRDSLAQIDIAADLIAEVMAIVEAARDDVLGRGTG